MSRFSLIVNSLSLIFCSALLLPVDGKNRGNHVCLSWVDPSSVDSFPSLDLKSFLSVNEESVVCRSQVVGLHDDVDSKMLNNSDSTNSNPSYEVGVVKDGVCSLLSTAQNETNFDIAASDTDLCKYFWVPIAHDVNPLNPTAVIVGKDKLEEGRDIVDDIAICTYDSGDGKVEVGKMYMTGKWFGHCGILSNDGQETKMIGGGYSSLSAWPVVEVDGDNDDSEKNLLSREEIFAQIEKRVNLYITEADKEIISKITEKDFDDLMEKMRDETSISTKTLSDVLSMERFIAHDLNIYGLSLLRAILAERMTNARRRIFKLDNHPDTKEWETNGVLLKDFDYFSDPENQQEFQQLLQMCGALESLYQVPDMHWSEKIVVADNNDPQQQPHIDTFHSVVKMWVYERDVVKLEHGPLHFMRGSTVNNEGKLRWIYNMTLPPAIEAIKEPSFRYGGNPIDDKMSDVIQPVLPLKRFKRTLIIADTSGVHHRGNAVEGIIRRTLRVQAGLDGGLPRQSPFEWEGWDSFLLITENS